MVVLACIVFAVLYALASVRVLSCIQVRTIADDKVDGAGVSPQPGVSIIIPMRNEERNARECILSALAQRYPHFEVLVVDDQSTDMTPQILEEIAQGEDRLGVVTVREKPEGWIGKTYALDLASHRATGELLLFVDADTRLEPLALGTSVSYMSRMGYDMLSLYPAQKLGTFWERVVVPMVFTIIFFINTPRNIHDPEEEDATACGQFILIKRGVYEASGRHAAVKLQIVEDMELAIHLKSLGYTLGVAGGAGLVTTRMYTSASEMWEGWTKNMYPAVEGKPSLMAMALAYLIGWAISPILIVFISLAAYISTQSPASLTTLATGLVLYAMNVAVSLRVTRKVETSARYSLTTPLGSAYILAAYLTSAYKVMSGKGVTWKGRRYRTSRP